MVLAEPFLVSLFTLWDPAMKGCLWECQIHGTECLVQQSFFLFLTVLLFGGKGEEIIYKLWVSCIKKWEKKSFTIISNPIM